MKEDIIDFIKSFLAQDEIFEMTNARRKSGGADWHRSLAAVIFSLQDNNNEAELPQAQRRLYALIFASCATKAGAGGSSPSAALADSDEQFGLDRSGIE